METIVIYSRHSGILVAQSDKILDSFFDEMSKIAETSPDNKAKLKKWLKASAVIAAGQGVGHGISYIGDRIVSKAMHTMPSHQRMNARLVAGTLAGLGASYAYSKMMDSKNKLLNKD